MSSNAIHAGSVQFHESEPRRRGAMTMLKRVPMGIGLSGVIGALAYWRKMLTRGGVMGSMTVGTVVFAVGGVAWSAVVVIFFASSSLLSRISSERKRRVASDKFSKPGARDWLQTMANGGAGTLAALLYGIMPAHPTWLRSAFVGAFATAAADTWATEIGTLARAQPRLITSGRPVVAGTSGGVTGLGTLAAVVGAATVGLAADIAIHRTSPRRGRLPVGRLVAIGACAGLLGAMVDSLLGATVQRMNWCPGCESETERTIHRCGTETKYLRGLRWMDNDAVNLLSTFIGAASAAAISHFLTHLNSTKAISPI